MFNARLLEQRASATAWIERGICKVSREDEVPRRASDRSARDPRGDLALEAVVPVSNELGIATRLLKPCIAYYLDGHYPDGLARHHVAFVLAMELREITDANEPDMRTAIRQWAKKIDYSQRKAERAIQSALSKKPNGEWRWKAPGIKKKKGTRYAEVLGPVCESVGCPAHCPRYRHLHVGSPADTYDRFLDLGWDAYFARSRKYAPMRVYQAICVRERVLGFVPGSRLHVTHDQLAELASVNTRTVGRVLPELAARGLITYAPGSGSGPHARDRRASEISRVTPIPRPQKS